MYHSTSAALRSNEPDWFRLGRDAVRVMSQLTGMKELDFYLRHPEPFIRLHAIRRIAVLMLPEAIPNLSRMLDDPLENEQNRDEAGWAIRRISLARGLPWFAHSEYTNRYEGTELPADRYGVTIADGGEERASAVSRAIPDDARMEDEVLLRIQMEEKKVSVDFSPVSWLSSNFRHLTRSLACGIINLLKFLFLATVHVMSALVRRIHRESIRFARFLHRRHQESLAARQTAAAAAKATAAAAATAAATAAAAATASATTAAAAMTLSGSVPAACPADIPSGRKPVPAGTAVVPAAQATGKADSAGIATAKSMSAGTGPDKGRFMETAPVFSLASSNGEKPVFLIGLAEAGLAMPSGTLASAMTVGPSGGSRSYAASIGTFAGSGSPALSIGPSAIHSSQFPGLSAGRHTIHTPRRRRKGGVSMFRLLFYPVRLVKQHWLFTIAVVVSFYIVLGFSFAGRSLVHNLNPRALFTNDRLVAVTQAAFIEFFGLKHDAEKDSGLNPATQAIDGNTAGTAGDPAITKQADVTAVNAPYRVTASKGLNLRSEPLQTSTRKVWMPLDAKVAFKGGRETDEAGNEWMQVTYEGQTGWAMAKWLNPADSAPQDGGSDGKP